MGCLLARLAGDDDAQVTEPQPRDDKCGHQSILCVFVSVNLDDTNHDCYM